MIKILNANEIEDSWFNGRVFGETNQTVQEVIADVVENGDSALKKYGQKFDVSAPSFLQIPEMYQRSSFSISH